MTNFDAECKKIWATLGKMSEDRKQAAAAAEAQRKKDAAAAEAQRKKDAAAAETQRKKDAAEAEMQRKKDKESLLEYEERRRKAGEEFDRRMDQIAKQIGGFTNNYSEALEEEFFRAMEGEMRIGDIPLNEVRRNSRNRYEYDIVGINGDCVAVGEIKHKLLPKDVIKFAEERLPYYAEDFPGVAKNRKVLGMIGGGLIPEDAQMEAEKRGLMILRLKNKKLVVENFDGARPVASLPA